MGGGKKEYILFLAFLLSLALMILLCSPLHAGIVSNFVCTVSCVTCCDYLRESAWMPETSLPWKAARRRSALPLQPSTKIKSISTLKHGPVLYATVILKFQDTMELGASHPWNLKLWKIYSQRIPRDRKLTLSVNQHKEAAKSVDSGIRQTRGQIGQGVQLAATGLWSRIIHSLSLGFLVSNWG